MSAAGTTVVVDHAGAGSSFSASGDLTSMTDDPVGSSTRLHARAAAGHVVVASTGSGR